MGEITKEFLSGGVDITIWLNNEGKERHTIISTDAQVFVIFCVVLTCRSALSGMVKDGGIEGGFTSRKWPRGILRARKGLNKGHINLLNLQPKLYVLLNVCFWRIWLPVSEKSNSCKGSLKRFFSEQYVHNSVDSHMHWSTANQAMMWVRRYNWSCWMTVKLLFWRTDVNT